MSNDIYERIQKLIESYQDAPRVKKAASEREEELKEYAIVPEQEPEMSEFSKEMDRIIKEHFPTAVAAKDELDEEDAVSTEEEIQEESPASTDVYIADEDEESVEPESPLAVGEDAIKELKNAKKYAKALSDERLISEFQKAVQEIVGYLTSLEKVASLTGVMPMTPMHNPQDVVAGVMKQAQTDADLINLMKQAQVPVGVSPAEFQQAVEQTASEAEKVVDDVVNEVEKAVDEVVEEFEDVLDEVAKELDEVITEVEDELKASGQEEAAKMVRPLVADQVARTFGLVPAVPVTPEEGKEEVTEEKKEEKEEEETEEVMEELEELNDEETTNELGNALEDLGLTPDELVEEAKDKEAKKYATIIARAVKQLKMAKKFKRTAAIYSRHQKLRNAMKNYLLELIS